MLYPARSILALDASPFGPSLSLLAAVRALRSSYPKAFLVAAAPAGTCELLSAYGLVDDAISLGVIRRLDRGPATPLKRLFGLFRKSRRFDFDLVLDFSPRIETQIVTHLALRARVITPWKLPRAIAVLRELGGASRSAVRRAGSDYANILLQLGVEMNDKQFAIKTSTEEDARFEHRLASSGSRGGELIALLYAADLESGRGWPAGAFGEIGTRLTNNFDARVVAVDEPSDDAFTRTVGASLPAGAIKLAEPRALELMAAIARASIVITDEPAIARIASELSTPVVEIAEGDSAAVEMSATHRIARGSSRRRVSPDEVFDIAGEMIQESRSPSLFRRP